MFSSLLPNTKAGFAGKRTARRNGNRKAHADHIDIRGDHDTTMIILITGPDGHIRLQPNTDSAIGGAAEKRMECFFDVSPINRSDASTRVS